MAGPADGRTLRRLPRPGVGTIVVAATPKPFGEMTEIERDAFTSAFMAATCEAFDHPMADEARVMADDARRALDEQEPT